MHVELVRRADEFVSLGHKNAGELQPARDAEMEEDGTRARSGRPR